MIHLKVNPTNQPLVIINHRSTTEAFNNAIEVLKSLNSKMVHLSYIQHDKISADTQVL